MKSNKPVILGGIILLAVALVTRADDPAAPPESSFMKFCEQDYLLGNWGGLRTNLSNHGIDFEFFYAGSVPNNLDGGIKTGSLYQGALLMTLDLDSDKLVGYHGGTFHVGSLWLNGAKPFSADYVGDLNKVNLLDFPNSFRLWELWYRQKFFDDKLSFKFGDLVVDDDFIVPEYYYSIASITFLNQTFFYPTMAFDVYDIPGFPPRYHGLPSTPNAAPGAVLRWDPAPQFYAQAAVYSGDPDLSSSGTRFSLSQTEGALSYFEIGYRLNQQKDDSGLGGSYKLGAWFHTGDFDDVYDGMTAAVFPGHPSVCMNITTASTCWPSNNSTGSGARTDPAQQGLVGFFRVAGAPANRNLAQFGVDGGLVYKGLIPKRNWDTLGLGLSYLQISDDIRNAQRDINATVVGLGGSPPFTKLADYEGVIEVSYKAQMTAWWTIQPSLQRVFHPGGGVSADIPDAWVFIIQTTLRF